MEAACASVGVLDAGFTVEPCPTMSSALDKSEGTKKTSNAQRPTSNPELKTSEFTHASEFQNWAFGVRRWTFSSLFAKFHPCAFAPTKIPTSASAKSDSVSG